MPNPIKFRFKLNGASKLRDFKFEVDDKLVKTSNIFNLILNKDLYQLLIQENLVRSFYTKKFKKLLNN